MKNRKDALLNLIKGLSMNDYPYLELIVVHMNEDTYDLPVTSFQILSFGFQSEEPLPLAKARNFACSKASADYCIFLDVDCIPAQNFIDSYLSAFKQQDILWSGNVRYLKTLHLPDLHTAALQALSAADPIRAELETLPYELFWSLNFGCSKKTFDQIGGFDADYKGYGAEDTDFAFLARANRVKLGMVNAFAYHQPHPGYSPPLNHLKDIVNNARIFYEKWKVWPMEGWLKKFEELGYISLSNDKLVILSYPEASVIKQFLKP